VKNELQAVAVLSLAGAMRQISSLAKQAESLMGDLCDTLADYNRRALYLDDRIKQLKRKVKKINPIEEAETNRLFAIPYDSNHHISQQLLSIRTAPEALQDQYLYSDKNPPFNLFTSNLTGGQQEEAMKLYSNPQFFFDNWREQMRKKELSKRNSQSNIESIQNIPQPPKVEKGNKGVKETKSKSSLHTSSSSTLPIRIKKTSQSKADLQMAFNSMRGKKGNKQRAAVTDETFIVKDQSESSGYMSQQSSRNSIMDNEQSTHSAEQLNGATHTSNNNMKVLSHRKNSVSSELQNGRSQKKSLPVQNGALRLGSVSPSVFESNKMAVAPPPTHFHSSIDLTSRKRSNTMIAVGGTSPGSSQSPYLVSPNPSPGIRRRAESITFNLVQESPPQEVNVPQGEIFEFPNPLEILKNSNGSLENGAVVAAFTQLDSVGNHQVERTIDQRRSSVPRRPAPTPPTNRRQSKSFDASPERNRKMSGSSSENSPRLHRYSMQVPNSPSIPRRMAPPPPANGRRGSNSSPKRTSKEIIVEPESFPQGSPSPIVVENYGPLLRDLEKRLSQDLEHQAKKLNKQTSKDREFPSPEAKRSLQKQLSGEKKARKKSASEILQSSGVKTTITSQRMDLLYAIRRGIQLKKVKQREEEEAISDNMPWDVAAILKRTQYIDEPEDNYDDRAVMDAEWDEDI
jgi:WAS family protein 3